MGYDRPREAAAADVTEAQTMDPELEYAPMLQTGASIRKVDGASMMLSIL